MWTEGFIDLIDKLNSQPKDISKFIKKEFIAIEYKGYGTPELEIKFLHDLFLYIQATHPEFESFEWDQCNSYNDNYYHFQLMNFTVNNKFDVDSNIDFYFAFNETDKMDSNISFYPIEFPDTEEFEFANINKLKYDKKSLSELDYQKYFDYLKKKYEYLELPCLKFITILKLLEIHFSMYYFIYTFGNGNNVKFTKDEVIVTKRDLNELEGYPLE